MPVIEISSIVFNIINAIVLALVWWSWRKSTGFIREWFDLLMLMRDSLRTMIAIRIMDNAALYLERGYATYHEKQELMKLFKKYQRFGGNGVIEHEVDKVMRISESPPARNRRSSDTNPDS